MLHIYPRRKWYAAVSPWFANIIEIGIYLGIAILVPPKAYALEGRCLLEVDGHVYLSATCNIEFWDGGLSIGTGDSGARSKYFAFVNIKPDKVAQGYWNGVEGESHAQEDLGTLVRQGACWVNKRARVCAWK
jgi:hypothetical protein